MDGGCAGYFLPSSCLLHTALGSDREEAGGGSKASLFSFPQFASLAACTAEVFTLRSTVEFDSGKWRHVGFIFLFFS